MVSVEDEGPMTPEAAFVKLCGEGTVAEIEQALAAGADVNVQVESQKGDIRGVNKGPWPPART